MGASTLYRAEPRVVDVSAGTVSPVLISDPRNVDAFRTSDGCVVTLRLATGLGPDEIKAKFPYDLFVRFGFKPGYDDYDPETHIYWAGLLSKAVGIRDLARFVVEFYRVAEQRATYDKYGNETSPGIRNARLMLSMSVDRTAARQVNWEKDYLVSPETFRELIVTKDTLSEWIRLPD
jgi:hypothetical protein